MIKMAYGIACALYFIIHIVYISKFYFETFSKDIFGRQISKVFVIDSLSDIAMYMYKDSEYQDGSISTN